MAKSVDDRVEEGSGQIVHEAEGVGYQLGGLIQSFC